MMMNLFSVFDPCTGLLSLNWMSSFCFIMFLPMNYWVLMNSLMLFISNLLNYLFNEMNNLINFKSLILLMLSFFLIILFNNIPGLMPYVFTSSAHLVFSLSFSLPLWVSFMLYGWLNNSNHMFCHLLPMGTPGVLMPFMVLIETISNIIRPGSLSVRLTANMIAGHLLMSLMGNNTCNIMMIYFMFIYLILMVFELAVGLIQAYVFVILSTLYSSEV